MRDEFVVIEEAFLDEGGALKKLRLLGIIFHALIRELYFGVVGVVEGANYVDEMFDI